MNLSANPVLSRVVALAAYFVCSAAAAGPWSAAVDPREGLPVVSVGGAVAMSGSFAFWGSNWAWAEPGVRFEVVAPFAYSVTGKNRMLDLGLNAEIKRSSNHRLTWAFDLDAARTLADVVGGGIAFKFDLAKFGAELGTPRLLPGNRGWAWGRTGGTRMEMRFDPPLASVYFERGQASEIRAFFYEGEIPRGQRRYVATLDVSGAVTIAPTTAERFGPEDPNSWPANIMDWRTAPVDLSFLNASEKPAGRRGFVHALRDRLVFEDGTRARFWGTNLTAYALFGTSREGVRQQAHRLSALGFNLVRLHHVDSVWVNPNIFGDNPPDTRHLSAAMLDKLDWWIKCLKDEGIYIWLDLHVGRQLTAHDGIEGFEEIAKGGRTADLRGYNYVNPGIEEAMKRFDEQYLTHRNRYTGLRYLDDPAIAAVLVTNENDLTNHFGNALLPDKDVPIHSRRYMTLAARFAMEHGLPPGRTWRAWEPGPSKLFLNDLEHRFDTGMISYLRSLGVKVPIVTTSTWGDNPLSALPALTAGDIIDVHSYGGVGALEKNPLYAPNLIDWMAAGQVAGKPLTVSEWNVAPFPVPDRGTIPLYVAASASMQGWDALMQYAYAQVPLVEQGGPSNWNAYNDPALMATLPAAALLYRRGDVTEARNVYAFEPSAKDLFGREISPVNAVALRTAAEKGKLVIVLPRTDTLTWLTGENAPSGATILHKPNQSLIPEGATQIVSDTGELRRDWVRGTYSIDTPRTQAAMGWIGGNGVSLSDVQLDIATRNASVAVQSLDQRPIRESQSILISLGARSEPRSEYRLPFLSEPVEGKLAIRAPRGLTLYAKYGAGEEERRIPAPYESGRYHIDLDQSLDTYWLELRHDHRSSR